MDDDPIVEEIRRIREKQAAEYGYDIERQMKDSQRRQYLWGNDVVARSKATGKLEVIFKGTGHSRFHADRSAATDAGAANE